MCRWIFLFSALSFHWISLCLANPTYNLDTYLKRQPPVHITPYLAIPSHPKIPIEISGQTLKKIHYNHTYFQKSLAILNTHISETAEFNFDRFDEMVNIENVFFSRAFQAKLVLFKKAVNIKYSKFKDGIDFYSTNFKALFRFYRNRCDNFCSWSTVQFDQSAEFPYNHFEGITNFNQVQFKKDAIFSGSEFFQDAHFKKTIFAGATNFDHAEFDATADFQGATFNGPVNFNNTIFTTLIDLSHSIVNTTIDLTSAKPRYHKQKILINLINTDLNKIKIDYMNFTLFFPLKTLAPEKQRIYESLLHQFKSKGMEKSYERLYKEYKEWSYLETGSTWINTFNKLWWGYGLEKERILYWAMGILFFFTLINAALYPHLSQFFPDMEPKSFTKAPNLPPLVHYIYCLPGALLLTFYICFGGVLRALFYTRYKIHSFWLSFYVFLMFIFGFVCFLFIAQWIISGVFK